MDNGWRWSPPDAPAGSRTELWHLRDIQGVVRAEVYRSLRKDSEGKTYVWAVWPYHVTGNVGSAHTVIDARIIAEKKIGNQK
jgi:hypothetical protein